MMKIIWLIALVLLFTACHKTSEYRTKMQETDSTKMSLQMGIPRSEEDSITTPPDRVRTTDTTSNR